MRLGNYLWLFALVVLSPQAYAVDYYWWIESGQQFTSPKSACDYFVSQHRPEYGPGVLTKSSETLYRCSLTYNSAFTWINRGGDSCREGTEYDGATGECKAPDNPCLEKQGQSTNWSRSGTAPDGQVTIVGKMIFPPTTGCVDSCAIDTDRRDCKARTTGAYFCSGTGTFTGQQCSTTGTGEEFTPEDTFTSPEPETIKEDKPCVYAAEGDKQVCTSVKAEEVEGKICGTRADGSEVCVTKVPTKNGIDIRTEVTKQILEDGSTVTTKVDTATRTVCNGVNDCTTSTAKTTTTTRTDANGNKTGESSTCTGSACANSGNPDSDGDGVGDGTAECKPGEECSSSGEGQDWYTPGDDTFGSVLTQFAAAVKETPVAQQTTTFLTFQASGSCPRWSISVWVFDIDIDQLCSGEIPWGAIKAVILAAASFLAFRIALF